MNLIALLAPLMLVCAPVFALTAWEAFDQTTTDIVLLCLDDDGYRVYFDDGQTASHGENTTDPDEIFTRASKDGTAGYGERIILNADELNHDCPRTADQIE